VDWKVFLGFNLQNVLVVSGCSLFYFDILHAIIVQGYLQNPKSPNFPLLLCKRLG
jgi:hypothetical protein